MGKVAVRLMVKKRLNFKLTSYSTIKSTGFDGLEFFGNDMDGPWFSNFLSPVICHRWRSEKDENFRYSSFAKLQHLWFVIKYQIWILNTKTKNIFCWVNENFDYFFTHFEQGGQENRIRKKVFFFKVYKKVECFLKKLWVFSI